MNESLLLELWTGIAVLHGNRGSSVTAKLAAARHRSNTRLIPRASWRRSPGPEIPPGTAIVLKRQDCRGNILLGLERVRPCHGGVRGIDLHAPEFAYAIRDGTRLGRPVVPNDVPEFDQTYALARRLTCLGRTPLSIGQYQTSSF